MNCIPIPILYFRRLHNLAYIPAAACALLLVTPSGALADDPLFTPPFLIIPVGIHPWSVTVGDINADGRLDIATANSGSNTVSVMLGNGDGTFAPRMDFETAFDPTDVAIADLNADGKLDLATANVGWNNISVLLGNGDGTFQPHVDFPAGPNSVRLAIADLNADGKLDIATANAGHLAHGSSVSVLLGNGDGTFAPKTDYSAGLYPYDIAIGDLNLDGRPDLAVVSEGDGRVNLLFGNGDGKFSQEVRLPTGAFPHSVAIGDLDDDGKPDLVVARVRSANSAAGTAIHIGRGDGTFEPMLDFPTGSAPQDVAIGDLNGDGIPDLAVPKTSSDVISLLLGKGDGTFEPHIVIDPKEPGSASVAIGDLNGDGKQDLVVSNVAAGTVSILLNDGAPLVDVPVTDPAIFRLLPPYPNPVLQNTTVRFDLPAPATVRAEILNITGQRVRTLLLGGRLPAGRHAIIWDGTTDAGSVVSSGLYIIRVHAGGSSEHRKILVIR